MSYAKRKGHILEGIEKDHTKDLKFRKRRGSRQINKGKPRNFKGMVEIIKDKLPEILFYFVL